MLASSRPAAVEPLSSGCPAEDPGFLGLRPAAFDTNTLTVSVKPRIKDKAG